MLGQSRPQENKTGEHYRLTSEKKRGSYADATGNAAMNTKLSEDRAKGVVTFLMQQGNVPIRHIVAPGAMGEYGATATNETKAGRAENRRVEVKVLVNKGIAGS